MGELVVIVKEGNSQLVGVAEMSHDDSFIELTLAVFKDINVVRHFSFVFVLVLQFQVDVPIGIDVV